MTKETKGKLGSIALFLLAVESIINLSYYKDIIFSFVLSGFYLGVFYNQKRYPSIALWGKVWFSISLIFIFITLLHHFRSAFYLKYSYYIRKMNDLKSEEDKDQDSKLNIKNDVRFLLRDSQIVSNTYRDSISETSSMTLHK